MNLSEAAELEPKRGTHRKCGIQRILDDFDSDEDRATLVRLLAEAKAGERSAASVSRILSRVGIHYGGNQITYHLRGECSCPA